MINQSVFARRDESRIHEKGDWARWLAILGGVALLWHGLSRRSIGGLGLAAGGGYLAYRGLSGHNPIREAMDLAVPKTTQGVTIEQSVTINRPLSEVYAFWRQFENLPRFMEHVESVRPIDHDRYHWVTTPLPGAELEWDIEIVEDRRNELISWRSLPGSDVDHWGMVRFQEAPGGRGVEMHVRIRYSPPGGVVGAAAARLFSRVTAQRIKEDLRRAKELLEAGEIPTVEGQPSGRTESGTPG